MKKIVVILLTILVAAALLMAWAYRSLQGHQSESASESIERSVTTDLSAVPADSGMAGRRSSSGQDAAAKEDSFETDSEAAALELIIRDMANSTRAIDYAERLPELAELEPELAVSRLANLRVLCIQARVGGDVETRAVGPDLAGFCEGFNHDEWPLDHDAGRGAGSTSLLLERMVIQESMGRVSQEQHSDLFTELLRSARTPEQVLALLEYLHGSMDAFGWTTVWRLGADLQAQFYPEANLPEAQGQAIVLFKCRRFGGCGPQHQFRLVYCQNFLLGNCRSGTTVQDMVFQTTAPVTHALALEILDRI